MIGLSSRPCATSNRSLAAVLKLPKPTKAALKAGYHYGETIEAMSTQYHVAKADLPPGTYRNIMGNTALALGLIAAARRSGKTLFLGAYPITPASDILHELSKHKNFRRA